MADTKVCRIAGFALALYDTYTARTLAGERSWSGLADVARDDADSQIPPTPVAKQAFEEVFYDASAWPA